MNLLNRHFFSYITNVFRALLSRKIFNRVIIRYTKRQIYFTAVLAFSFVFWVSIFLGAIIIFEVFSFSREFGQGGFLGQLLTTLIVRELGPLLIALIVIGRSGTAIAAELGNMTVSSEIDYLESLGISPITLIVVPRILGVTISSILLGIIFSTVAILGGAIVSSLISHIAIHVYITDIIKALSVKDILINIIKCGLFGYTIALVSTYNGLIISKSPTQVPQAATRSVVSTILLVFIINGIFAISTFEKAKEMGFNISF